MAHLRFMTNEDSQVLASIDPANLINVTGGANWAQDAQTGIWRYVGPVPTADKAFGSGPDGLGWAIAPNGQVRPASELGAYDAQGG